jgi:hypothetical protein
VNRLFHFLWCLTVALPVLAAEPQCLTYGLAGTLLEGELTRVTMETRTKGSPPVPVKVVRWMLETHLPFCVVGNEDIGDIPVRGASSIELLFDDSRLLSKLIGSRVRVTGEIMNSMAPHYHAYLIMQVSSVGAVSSNPSLERP